MPVFSHFVHVLSLSAGNFRISILFYTSFLDIDHLLSHITHVLSHFDHVCKMQTKQSWLAWVADFWGRVESG